MVAIDLIHDFHAFDIMDVFPGRLLVYATD